MTETSVPAGARVLVAMSGGVDSSLAAVLLQQKGCDIVGVNMRTHRLAPGEPLPDKPIRTCCSPTDARDARQCAETGSFPFYVLDLEAAFDRDVIAPFVQDYLSGRTPNPCILCNNRVKLGLLLDKAALWGCSHVATGHYARKERRPDSGRWTLRRAADANKDQCYYLFGLTQEQLDVILFPLGNLTKAEVREQARNAGLPTADKPESQEICFVPDNDYRRFLRRRLAERSIAPPRGRFVSVDGEDLGEHEGIAFYTVGQRRGLGVAHSHALYVVDIDPATNNIILGPREAILSTGLEADGLSWMGWAGLDGPRRARVQIRYRHEPQPAVLRPSDSGRSVLVEFDEPAAAVAPGQAAVFWDDEDRVLGGGWIRRRLAPAPTA